MVFILAEAARYVVLVWQTRRIGIGFTRQDILATLVFCILILVFRELTMLAGLTGGIGEWIAQAGVPHG